MTNGQIAQLQDLAKCHISNDDDWRRVQMWLEWLSSPNRGWKYIQPPKAWLRRLTHQYRNQIRVIKRNQK